MKKDACDTKIVHLKYIEYHHKSKVLFHSFCI